MAIVSLTEAAELAGVSRGTLYNRLKRGELSRSGDGIDTSELMRVFGPINRPQTDTGGEHRASAADTGDASIDVNEHADRVQLNTLNTVLNTQLAAAERERDWLKGLVEEERARVAAREQELAEARARLDAREDYWSDKLTQVQALLPAPEPVRRKRFLGIF